MVERTRMCPGGHGIYAAEADVCVECGSRLVLNRVGEAVGDFVCERLIGQGGMSSTVWDGYSIADGSPVAIKIIESHLESQEARRLLKSASLTGLYHQNLSNVFAYGETDDGEAWITMELLKGPSLRAILQQRGALTLTQSLHVVREVLQALAFLHSHDIIHRDVKPANIHLTARSGAPWAVRLIDFGIAKQSVARSPDRLDLHESAGALGPILGTPEYMPPEQVLGHDVDARADLYSLGVVLYRLLTGELPFGPVPDKGDKGELYERHLRVLPIAPAAPDHSPLPLAATAAITTALQKHPGSRFHSAEAFMLALDGL